MFILLPSILKAIGKTKLGCDIPFLREELGSRQAGKSLDDENSCVEDDF